MAWQDSVEKAISEDCKQAYLKAQTDKRGEKYKKYHPYIIPEISRALVNTLNNDDEVEAKRLLLIRRTGGFSLI